MLNELYDVDTQMFRQSFWMINTSNCCTIESTRNDIMIFFLLFFMLYCNMINVRCAFIIFRFACLSSSWCLRSIVSNVFAIFFQKIYIEESSTHCWFLDCWSFEERWRCVDVLLTRTLRFLIFAMMIVCSMIFALCNYRFLNTWCLYLKKRKFFLRKNWFDCNERSSLYAIRYHRFVNVMTFFRCKCDVILSRFFWMQNRFKKSHVI
jgi:hypothetical protein